MSSSSMESTFPESTVGVSGTDKEIFVAEPTKEEIAIARQYKRITGQEPIGLIDTLRILFGDDMQIPMLNYLVSIDYYNQEVKL